MFSPAVAALLLRWVTGAPRGGLGLRVRPGPAYAYAYCLPPLLVGAGIALSLGIGYQHLLSDGLAPSASAVVVQLALAMTVGIAVNTMFALGEELGWRGYLLPSLQPLGGPIAAVGVGVVWGLWHAPVIALDGYEFGARSWLAAPAFCLSTVPFGVIMAWLRWRSGSVWPCAIMHAGINALSGLWLLLLSQPNSTFVGSAVGILGIIPFAVVATWLIATGRLRIPPDRAISGRRPTRLPGVVRPTVAVAVVLALLGITAIAGLNAGGSKALSAEDQAAVAAYADPATDNLMAALKNNDYSAASRDFDAPMRSALNESVFRTAKGQIERRNGAYISRRLDHVERRGSTITVFYAAHFSKADATITVSFHATAPHLISGWYVR